MATGSLDYPFSRVMPRPTRFSLSGELPSPSTACCDTGRIQELGELAVDRDTLHRIFLQNPNSLVPVLDALMSALNGNMAGELTGFALAVDDSDSNTLVQLRREQSA
jgi:hypothetical protein